MIEKPESPHDLVPFWPDIDETQLASVGAQYGKLSATATQALNKSRGDSKELNEALVEGFDTQVNGVLLVGGQHSTDQRQPSPTAHHAPRQSTSQRSYVQTWCRIMRLFLNRAAIGQRYAGDVRQLSSYLK
ncbi:hypothetical protein [Mycobacteroides abscessus]|uniref:hypothetical protein n=1 Tax=Mycobacteroides abscessus TaxID=36809 RepID=UPI000C269900|nr:hypothetical protein [Mycobacteroides abscessus]